MVAAIASAGLAGPAQPSDTTYDERCAACHQAEGQGIPEVFPKLAGDPVVTGDSAVVIGVLLNGRRQMPSFKDQLDDRTIAAVITYIRRSWGNAAGPVTEADVKAVRSGGTPNK